MKLIIDIPEETKQAFDKAESNDLKGGYYDLGGVIGKAIQNGIPLDSNSERAEVQAYFAGQTYGWEQGRKDLIDDVKAEFRISYPTNYAGEPELNGKACHFSLNKVLEIIDNVGKGE